jgi:hypothetical protein
MSERDGREKGDQTLLEAPRSDPASTRRKSKPYGSAADKSVRLRSPARREQPLAEPPEPDEEVEPQNRGTSGEARTSWFRRHPIAIAFGLLCLVLALPAGYLYWALSSWAVLIKCPGRWRAARGRKALARAYHPASI